MKYILLVIILVFTAKAEYNNFNDLLTDFSNIKTEKYYYDVKDIFIQKDLGKFILTEGKVSPLTPIDGDVIGFVFTGTGKFIYSNPDKVENSQLIRYFEKSMLLYDFKDAILLMPKSDWINIFKGLDKNEIDTYDDTIEKYYQKKINFVYKEGYLHPAVADYILNRPQYDFLYAIFSSSDLNDKILCINSLEEEEVSLEKGDYYNSYGYYTESICQSKQMDTNIRNKEQFDVLNYNIDINMDSRLHINSHINMKVIIKEDNINWYPFNLLRTLHPKSIEINSKNVAFYKKFEKNQTIYSNRNSSTLWIDFDNKFKMGDTINISLEIIGEIFDKRYPAIPILLSSISWYPHWDYKDKATFNIQFKIPDNYKVVASGDKISESETEDGFIISKWKRMYPVRNFSFDIGNFDMKSKKKDKNLPYDFEIYYNTLDQIKAVKQDVENSLNFYTNLYGKLDIDRFYAAEALNSGGEAFAGLINLFPYAFRANESYNNGQMETLASHEVAHQWWGISVDFDTYHDQWLSEAFAEYSSLLYIQLAYKDNKTFFKFLNEYREDLLDARKGLFFDGMEPGPVYLGYRNETSKTSGDYSLIVYKKGAWVLHMLRNMVMDINTLDDKAFFDAMKSFYKKSKGKKVTTYDFIKHFEYTFTVDMQWFFDQWVFDYKIPKYSYSLKSEEVAKNGKNVFSTKLYVRQDNVPDDFKASIPVTIKFDDEKYVRFRFFMTGKEIAVNLADYPMEPEEIIFNDFNSVLCDTDEIDWEDEFDTLIK